MSTIWQPIRTTIENYMARRADEREFLKLIQNHQAFKRQVRELRILVQLSEYETRVRAVVRGWFRLAEQHLTEAKSADSLKLKRSVYSRAYYAAYNASKAVRYMAAGAVSLHGDDHGKVGDLPKTFPDLARWAVDLTQLYEHRLRADYDNWLRTDQENSLTPADVLGLAEGFVEHCRQYLRREYRIRL